MHTRLQKADQLSVGKHYGSCSAMLFIGYDCLIRFMLVQPTVCADGHRYRGFYHSLLRPFVHYVPIWPKGKGPEDVVDGVRWALQNDEDARAIAAASQDFAHKFFTRKALSCYWYMLLSRFARLQAYQGERKSHTFFMTVEHYLDTVAKQHNNGREYNMFIFANGTEIKR